MDVLEGLVYLHTELRVLHSDVCARWARELWAVQLCVCGGGGSSNAWPTIHACEQPCIAAPPRCRRNVLLSVDWRAHLSDFSVSQAVVDTARTAAGGSTLHAAPELLLGQRCTLAADMYSLGILLIELTTQTLGKTRCARRLPQPPDECPAGLLPLIEACVSADPAQRPTAMQARAWLEDLGM